MPKSEQNMKSGQKNETRNEQEIQKVEQQSTAIVLSQYDDDAGGGFENQDQSDRAIPFLSVLQDLSPQVKPRDEKYVPGAIAGMIHNSLTNELYTPEEGVVVVAAVTEHCFVEWIPRSAGGGFINKFATNDPVVAKARSAATKRGKLEIQTPTGPHDLVETFYMYALTQKPKVDLRKGVPDRLEDVIDLDSIGVPVVIPFTSTKIQPYKNINTQLGMYKLPNRPHPQCIPPLWAYPLWLTTTLEKRTAGESWNFRFNFWTGRKIEEQKLLPRFRAPGQEWALYQAARDFRNAVRGGGIRVDYTQQNAANSKDAGGEDEIPF